MARNAAGPTDDQLRLIIVEAVDGSAICVLWNYACHPTIYPALTHVSADFPGVVRRAIRQRIGNQATNPSDVDIRASPWLKRCQPNMRDSLTNGSFRFISRTPTLQVRGFTMDFAMQGPDWEAVAFASSAMSA
jgi:hypothetical protein